MRDDARSEISGISYATRSNWHPAASVYGGGYSGEYPPSRPMSQLGVPSPYHNNNGSRMSLAPSEGGLLMGQGAGGLPRNYSGSDMEMMSELPSDDALLAEIRDFLRTADLMTVTKKSVRAELERRFGVPLEIKKQYIGSATEAILSGQL